MYDNSRRESKIILRPAEEARLHVVSLKTPGNRFEEFVVQTSADACGEGSVRPGCSRIHMPGSEQGFGEGTKLAYRH